MSCTMPPAPFEHNSLPSIPNKLFMFMLKKKEKLASTIIEIQRTICVLSRKSFRFFFQQIQKHIVPFICHIIPPNMNSTLVLRWFIQCQTHKKNVRTNYLFFRCLDKKSISFFVGRGEISMAWHFMLLICYVCKWNFVLLLILFVFVSDNNDLNKAWNRSRRLPVPMFTIRLMTIWEPDYYRNVVRK